MSGFPAARQHDMTKKGGPIVEGSLTVYIGSQGGVACSSCPGGGKNEVDPDSPTVGNPVNVLLGAKVQGSEVDVALPGALSFVVSRDYSSYQTDTPAPVGLLGPGWWLPGEVSLQQSETGLTLNDSKGRSIRFEPLAAGQTTYSRSENLWIVRGGRERLDDDPDAAEARLNMAWLGVAAKVRLNSNLFFVTNSPLGPWWILGPFSEQEDITGMRLPLLGLNDRFGRTLRMMRSAESITVQDGPGRQYRLEIKTSSHLANQGVGGWGSDTGARLVAVHLIHDPHSAELPEQPLVRYEYTPRGELSAVYARDGSRMRQFQYHPQLVGRMIAQAHAGRPPVQYVYNAEGKVIEQHRLGALSYRFDYAADRTTVTDSLERSTIYHFEGEAGLRRVTRVQHPDGSITQSRHDASGRLTALIDALGRETHFQLNIATGNVTAILLPGGEQLQTEYNAQGQIVQSVGIGGGRDTFQYDAIGRRACTSDALGHSTHSHYADDQQERPHEIVDARGGKRHLIWSPLGQLVHYSDCSGSSTRYRYDRWGNLVETQGEEGAHSASDFDHRGRLISNTNALGQSTTYAYNDAGDLTSVTSADGNSVRFERDTQGRPTVYHYGGYTQKFDYDAAGRLTLLTNENGAHTTFAYDVMDRLTRQVNFDGRTQSYRHDAAGQLIESDDEGIVSRYTYDEAGRLAHRQRGEGVAAPQEHYQYGKDGNLDKAWHRTELGGNLVTCEFIRDAMGRTTQETQIITGVDGVEVWRYSTQRAFDALGVEHQTTYDGLPAIEWLTYGAGHLHGVVLDGKTLIDFERDKLHRETSRRFGETQSTRTYDALSRLSRLHTHSPHIGEDYALNREHHYDLAGQLTRIDTGQGVHEYGYDKAGRLIAASQPGLRDQHYRFDPAGNRLFENTRAQTIQDNWEETVRQNLNDRNFNLLGEPSAQDSHDTEPKWMDNRIKDDGDYHYEYDAWGNTRRKYKAEGNEQHHFHYDSQHRLIQYGFESDDAVRGANYHYDVFGRRLCKQVQHGDKDGNPKGPWETTFFGWDGDRLVLTEKDKRQIHTIYEPGSFVPMIRVEGERRVSKQELIGDIQGETALRAYNQVMRDATRNRTLKNIKDNLLSLQNIHPQIQPESIPRVNSSRAINNNCIHFYSCDHIGTPQSLISQAGFSEWSKCIGPLGGSIREFKLNDLHQPISLQGQHCDDESGLHYNRYRYYFPTTGKYLSQDPIGLKGGLNNQAHSNQNPISYTDELGLFPGGWMTSPNPPPGGYHTIYCQNGNIELFIIPPEKETSTRAIENCLRVHESVHRTEALEFNPEICKGKKNGVAVVYYDGDEGGTSATFTNDSELRAYAAQIKCLNKARLDSNCNMACQQRIEFEIDERKKHSSSYEY